MPVWVHSSDLSGYAASALVFATFSMKSMRSLRIVAIASNLAFIAYALDGKLMPILILHSVPMIRNFSMTRKLSVTSSQWVRQFLGSSSRRNLSIAMLKSLKEPPWEQGITFTRREFSSKPRHRTLPLARDRRTLLDLYAEM